MFVGSEFTMQWEQIMGKHILEDYVLAELEAIRSMTAGQSGWEKFNSQLEAAMEAALEKMSSKGRQ